MTNEAISNREAISEIKRKLNTGELSYDEAKAQAKPIIEAIYAKHKEIAKKHNKRAVKLTFAGLMR